MRTQFGQILLAGRTKFAHNHLFIFHALPLLRAARPLLASNRFPAIDTRLQTTAALAAPRLAFASRTLPDSTQQ